jgi:hypothetical protein
MRQGVVACLLSLGAVACITPAEGPSSYHFPKRFSAIQLIRVEHPQGTTEFAATLDRESDAITVVVLEPITLRPLLRLEDVSGTFSMTQGASQELPLPEREGRWLLATLRAMLDAKDQPLVAGFVEKSLTAQVWYRLEAFEGGPECRWPRRIEWQMSQPRAIRVKVENREWTCLP